MLALIMVQSGQERSVGKWRGAPRGLPIKASLAHAVQPQHPLTNTGPSSLLYMPKGDQPAACAVLLCL